jgi:hypothetical protein
MTITEEDLREEAKRRVQKRRDLGAHVVVYIVVNAVLVGMWVLTGAGYFWPAWVMLAWGVGLILNVWDVFFRRAVTEHDIEREMSRLRR